MIKKNEKYKLDKLPKNPLARELKEIGIVVLSALENSQDDDIRALILPLKSSNFKPFTSKHYIADWYLKEDTNVLYCGRLGDLIRFQYEVQLSKDDGVWKSIKPVSRMMIYKKNDR